MPYGAIRKIGWECQENEDVGCGTKDCYGKLYRLRPSSAVIPGCGPFAEPEAGRNRDQQEVAAIDDFEEDEGEKAERGDDPYGGENLLAAIGGEGVRRCQQRCDSSCAEAEEVDEDDDGCAGD